jgi:DNA modification methylase
MSKQRSQVKQDSIFKNKVPVMPEGYYSGDKPNPNLRAFVEAHLQEKPYDPGNDDYNVPAFDKPIESTKATAIYNMHTYWSKKPHDAIRQYIRHYTQPGDLVLDPFCGSGGTALAALMEGRKAIAIDRSPAATFITKNYCTPVDVEELQKAFKELKAKVKPELDWLYETRCNRCGGPATTAYTVYSQVFECPRCLEKISLFDCVQVQSQTKAGKAKKIKACPHCYRKGQVEEISTRSEKFGAVPVLVSYLCEGECKPKRDQRSHNDPDPKKREYFKKYDLGKIREIEGKEIPYWYPTDRMMHAPEDQECWGVKWRAGTSNFRTVDELFTKRNLWALAAIKKYATEFEGIFLFAITAICLSMSKMYLWGPTDEHGIIKGTYYLPQLSRSQHVFEAFESKISDVISAKKLIHMTDIPDLHISTENAASLNNILSNSVDYIFTDPPYADKVQYGELNFIWESWLAFDTHWHDEEIIVNEVRGKTPDDWTDMMRQAMKECYRILKPGRWLSLCYHDTSEGTWSMVQDIMSDAGFIPDKSDSALFIDTGQKSYNQLTADKVTKRDLVINFRKPKTGELSSALTISDSDDERTFVEKAQAIVRDYLSSHPGSSKDRVYDELVSRMVRRGQMEAHNFDQLLQQVAEEVKEPLRENLFVYKRADLFGTHEIGRWYLKESELDITDEAETVKEDAAAKSVAGFIAKWLKKNPHQEGVHYSDIFEHYIYAVNDKPRRQLQDWLPDYFYKTTDGTYRLPANKEEEEAKAKGRLAGINRRIKRYVAYLTQGVPVPEKQRPSDATLAEWIRQCKLTGLYAEGKTLFEKGGLDLNHLSEEIAANVEEDYMVCLRMLSRVQPKGKG